MIYSVDIGYYAVKAVSGDGAKVAFPSVVADVRHNPVNGIGFFKSQEYHATVRDCTQVKQYLIGEAATHSLVGISTMRREKPPEIHDLLVMTAAYLCGAGSLSPAQSNGDILAVGLPLAYYLSQKEEISERLKRLHMCIKVDNMPERYVSFADVLVYPQGVGAILSMNNLPDGYVGLLDIGCYTTDFMLFAVNNEDPVIINDGCGSIEAGTYLVQQDVAAVFQKITGAPLASFMQYKAMDAARTGKTIPFGGKDISLQESYEISVQSIAKVIIERVRQVWVNQAEYLSLTALAGGGSEVFEKSLKNAFPSCVLAEDAIFANANGYLLLAG